MILGFDRELEPSVLRKLSNECVYVVWLAIGCSGCETKGNLSCWCGLHCASAEDKKGLVGVLVRHLRVLAKTFQVPRCRQYAKVGLRPTSFCKRV